MDMYPPASQSHKLWANRIVFSIRRRRVEEDWCLWIVMIRSGDPFRIGNNRYRVTRGGGWEKIRQRRVEEEFLPLFAHTFPNKYYSSTIKIIYNYVGQHLFQISLLLVHCVYYYFSRTDNFHHHNHRPTHRRRLFPIFTRHTLLPLWWHFPIWLCSPRSLLTFHGKFSTHFDSWILWHF